MSILKNKVIASDAERALVQDILDSISYMSYEFKDLYLKYDSEGVESIISSEEDFPKVEDTEELVITRSPIFCKNIVDNPVNTSLLSVIFNDIPYYYTKPTNIFATSLGFDGQSLSESRDPGIIDVPSMLQTSFWATLFRDAFGDVTNNFILDIHNKFKYPFIGENQYINARLFPSIAQQVYIEDTSSESGNLVEFKYTADDNLLDILKGEQGCVDYLNSVINSKILSLYNLLDYHPDQAGILSAWAESKYWSGQLEESDVEREKSIYRLQDIKYELLRRKFAGSSTLYNISFSAIDRRGSFVNTTSLGNLNIDDSSRQFDDKRIARVLDLPGLLTEVLPVTSYDPINTFYTQPNRKNQDAIGLDLLIPLFYTSAPISNVDIDKELPEVSDFVRDNSYSSDSFFKDIDNMNTVTYGDISKNPYVDYRSYFLRNVGRTVNWDTPESTINTRSLRTVYPKLDYYEDNLELENVRNYRTLDGPYEDKAKDYTYPIIKLDLETTILRNTEFTSSVMDLSADTILYNENSYQKILGEDYPYITYPLANNNSISMMDIPWLDYIEASTVNKSRVQDIVNYGTQISTFNVINNGNQTAPYSFFAISYGDEDVNMDSDYLNNTFENFYSYSEFIAANGRKPTRAYIWYVTLNYDVFNEEEDFTDDSFSYKEAFRVSNTEVYPVTVISLALDSFKNPNYNKDDSESGTEYLDYYKGLEDDKFAALDTFEDFKKYNTGVIPFTYPQFKISDTYGNSSVKNNLVFNRQSYLDGIYNTDCEFDIYTSLEEQDLTRAYFVFSNYNVGTNLTGSKTWGFIDENNNPTLAGPLDESENERDNLFTLEDSNNVALKAFGIHNIFSMLPSEETKTVYYSISRPYASGTTASSSCFTWSSPIPVVALGTDTFKELLQVNVTSVGTESTSVISYRPDWFKLGYFLNPNLNFSGNTASPLRGKDTLSSTHRDAANQETDLFEREVLNGTSEKEVVSQYKRDPITKEIICDNSGKPIIETVTKVSEVKGGASSSSILSNLTRVRGMDYLSNDDGRLYTYKDGEDELAVTGTYCYDPTKHSSQILLENEEHTLGFFLEKISTSDGFNLGAAEFNDYVGIFGDNRQEDLYDSIVSHEGFVRSDIFSDPVLGVYGLYFENHTDEFTENLGLNPTKKNLNYYQLVPYRKNDTPICELTYNKETHTLEYANESNPTVRDASNVKVSIDNWYLNKQIKRENGFSMFFNVRVIKDKLDFFTTSEVRDDSNNVYNIYNSDNEVLTLFKSNNVLLTLELKRIKDKETIEVVYNKSKKARVNVSSLDSNLRIGCSIEKLSETQDEITTESIKTLLTVNDIVVEEISTPRVVPSLEQENIILFTDVNDKEQFNIFKGIVYDYRLYGRPMSSKLELLLTNQGTIRELYSYSPDIYKLAEHVHRELGIFKIQKPGLVDELPEIDSIRIFNRGTWDSLLVDRYPISNNEIDSRSLQYSDTADTSISKFTLDKDIFLKTTTKESLDSVTEKVEYELNDAIQQELTPIVEVVNGFKPLDEKCTLYYQGNPINLDTTKDYSLVTTTLKSTDYQNEALTSGGQISWNDDTKSYNTYKKPITMPISSVGNTLKYSTDLYVNFKLENSGDLAAGISYGANTIRQWNDILNRPTIKVDDTSAVKDNENFSETTFIIPTQSTTGNKDLTKEFGLLDKFYIKDFVFGEDFTKYLDVNNYYGEFYVPYFFGGDKDNYNSYGLKWFGVRQLREGVYYFTVKHPAMIHPFEKSRFEKQSEAGEFPTYNLASRFKVVVSGTPVEYIGDEEYFSKYNYHKKCTENLVSYLEDGQTRYTSEDNMSFPHRKITIDLYVLDSDSPIEKDTVIDEKTSFYWKKIASNTQDILNKPFTNSQLTIRQEIPMFLTNSLETPFFVAQENKDSYDSKTPVVNTIKPLTVRWVDSIEDKERLTVNNNASDFDGINLIAGRAYRLLFGLSSKVTEISYSNKFDNSESFSEIDIENCYRAHSLIHNFGSYRDFMYTTKLTDLFNTAVNSSIGLKYLRELAQNKDNKNTCWGYSTAKDSFAAAGDALHNLGDPYSKMAKDNLLYSLSHADTTSYSFRTVVDNLNVIPYKPVRTVISSASIFKSLFPNSVSVVNETSGSALSKDIKLNNVINKFEINTDFLESNNKHFITEYSVVKPSLKGRVTAGSWENANNQSYIGAVSYKLYEYKEPNRPYSLKTTLNTPIYKSLYLNNLIKDINFLDTKSWKIYSNDGNFVPGEVIPENSITKVNSDEYKNYFTYESDTSYGRDVFKIKETLKEEDVKTFRIIYNPVENTSVGNNTDFEVVVVVDKDITESGCMRLIPLKTSSITGQSYEPLTKSILDLNNFNKVNKDNGYFEYSTTLTLSKEESMASIAFEVVSGTLPIKIANVLVRYRKVFEEKSRDFGYLVKNSTSSDDYKLKFHTKCVSSTTRPASYIAYRNENTKYFLPIQIPSKKRVDATLQYSLNDNWFTNYGYLEEENLNGGVGWRRILPPWVKRLTFEEISSNDGTSSVQSTSGPEYNFVLKSCKVSKTNEGFKVVEDTIVNQVFDNIEMSYEDTSNTLNIDNINIKTVKGGYLDGALEDYPLNIKVNLNGDGGYVPITLQNENVSGITNSFYPNRFINGISSPIVVTNVQYVDKNDNVLYEYEFLPIVYDETRHHISFNTLLVK